MQVITTTIANTHVQLRVTVADTWLQRFRGLLGHPSPGVREGMLISRCKAIHTLGMAYPIDAVFLDRDWLIVGVAYNVQPGRIHVSAPRRSGAAHVLELCDGEALQLGLRPGLRLRPHGFSVREQFDQIVEEAASHPDTDMHESTRIGG